MVRFANGWIIAIAIALEPCEIWPSKGPEFKWSHFRSHLYSNPYTTKKWKSVKGPSIIYLTSSRLSLVLWTSPIVYLQSCQFLREWIDFFFLKVRRRFVRRRLTFVTLWTSASLVFVGGRFHSHSEIIWIMEKRTIHWIQSLKNTMGARIPNMFGI